MSDITWNAILYIRQLENYKRIKKVEIDGIDKEKLMKTHKEKTRTVLHEIFAWMSLNEASSN
jgi:hypothetical protein